MEYVAYYRVSTKKQEDSGLGLEAQRTAVANTFGSPIAEFTEIESGRANNRPELNKAIEMVKAGGHTLVIARLDRLSRNVSFVSNLMDSGIKFKCADCPEMDNFTVHLFAAMAQREAQLISLRTKAALTELKSKGVKLGCPEVTSTGKTRLEVIMANRERRVYAKPDPSKVATIRKLRNDGYEISELKPIAEQLFGKSLSLQTVYNYCR